MSISKFLNRIALVLILSILLISAGCDGLGIYAVVAVTDIIDEGRLPEGISGRSVVLVPTNTDYALFASGPGLWAKNVTTDSLWYPTPIVDTNGDSWDGIQSMAASGSFVYFAFYRINSNDTYTVALFYMTSFNGSSGVFEPLAGTSSWTSTATAYQTVRMYCPDPAGDVYINVLRHSGEYGSIDGDENKGFIGSNLYAIPLADTALNIPGYEFGVQTELDGTSTPRYVTGIASSGAIIRYTATNNLFSSTTGILLNELGLDVGLGSIVSTTGITWLPLVDSGVGAFITSSTAFDSNSRFPMWASADGDNWTEITNGTSTDFLTVSFIDVSTTTAGDTSDLVLAGTSSYIDGSTGRIARGYQEINTTALGGADIANWSVNNSAESYDFARNNNYAASELSLSTILGMTQIGNDLYASTRSAGIWRIDVDTESYPSWGRE